jgi:3-dehydroquinate dehydratase
MNWSLGFFPSFEAHVSKLALRKSFRGASRTAETTIGGLEVSF